MRITILTLFPEMFTGFLNTSIIKRILDKGIAEFKIVNIRDYSLDKHRHVDDTPYGGGAGMLMRVDVLHRALLANCAQDAHVLLTSPKARPFKQEDARRFAAMKELVVVCGHYEGVDHRFEKYCDEKFSLGDFVLTGGELAAMVLSDAVLRLLDEGISADSLNEESYTDGLLEYPQYTRPYEYEGAVVPEVLTNGNHALIRQYNLKTALKETLLYRPDLLEKKDLTAEEAKLLEEVKDELSADHV